LKRGLGDPVVRRAALIATAATLPIIVIALVLLSSTSDSSSTPKNSATAVLSPISVAAPPANAAADAPCTTLLGDLPTAIATSDGTLAGRPAQSTWTYVAAWGQPAVVLRCGVPRPAALTVNSGAFVIAVDNVNFFQSKSGSNFIYTAIDRAAYIEISVPTSYSQPPIGPIASAIATALPQVCLAQEDAAPAVDPAKLCTHRK
jgi:hypothetical protein